MIALFSLFMIVSLSMLIVRIGAIALELTGIPSDVAAFQAQSAFSGTGYTTKESEAIVNHPVRRNILRILILLGSAGLSSFIATLILTFINGTKTNTLMTFMFLSVGILVIFLLTKSKFLNDFLNRIITDLLQKHTTLKIFDYQEVLGLKKGYAISRFQVLEDSWMVDRTLADLGLRSEGVLVFSIQRQSGKKEESFIGAPQADTKIEKDDVLFCYGLSDCTKKLSRRQKDDKD